MNEVGIPIDTSGAARATRSRWRPEVGTGAVRVLAVVALLFAVLVPAGLAGAQDDPYGSTTTTSAAPGPTPSCRLSASTSAAGDTVVAQVQHAPRGGTLRVLFDGEPVAEAVAEGPGESPWVNVDIPFTVPEREPGTYPVTVVGAQMTASCGSSSTPDSGGSAEVRGLTISRGFDGPSPSASGGGLGALPKTGAGVLLLLAIALALVLVGRPLVTAARRRRAAAEAGPHLHR